MTTERVFVYGTLRKESSQAMAKLLVSNSKFLGEGHIVGALYDLGRYPGLLVGPDKIDAVYGQVFELTNTELVLSKLDYYEECSDDFPKPHMYQRMQCSITLADNSELSAWVYVYQRDVGECVHIPGGDYMAYLSQKKGA
jgi:gamma-glutamylcyclotransferase (GGCT)/AIG2-like uncharacterized protein YtfP